MIVKNIIELQRSCSNVSSIEEGEKIGAQLLEELSKSKNGIGLAAPQVHLSHRMFIYRNPDIEDGDQINISVLINPIIKYLSDETEDDWEGCLSIPGMSGLVRRFKRIKYSISNLSK